MPSFVPDFEYDIFISYRHNDNRSGWVTEFVNALQEELSATIKERLTIYFDKNPLDGLQQHHEVDDSLREKLKSLILIPIISQTYCDPKAFAWAHELIPFIQQASEDSLGIKTKVSGGNIASRVLPIKIHDIDASDKQLFEEATGGVMRSLDFTYKESGVNRPLRPTDDRNQNQERTDYRNQVNKVANAIKEILLGLQGVDDIIAPTENTETKAPSTYAPRKVTRSRSFRFPTLQGASIYKLSFALMFLAFVALAYIHFTETPPDQPTYRSTLLRPENKGFSARGDMAISPDGKSLAFTTQDSANNLMLSVRSLDGLTSRVLKGTEGAYFPFWSPDSRFIGFFANNKLNKIAVAGGPPQVVCAAISGRGGSWNSNDIIIFCPDSQSGSSLYSVAAAGGTPKMRTKLDTGHNHLSHRWPHFLPDGQHFLYTVRTASGVVGNRDGIYIGSLDSTFVPRLLVNANSSVEVANGYLLFLRDQTLFAQIFDKESLSVSGQPFPVEASVAFDVSNAKGSFSASQNGALVYKPGTNANKTLLWKDRAGKYEASISPSASYRDFSIAPDEKRIVASRIDEKGTNSNIWIYEISRKTWTRLTFGLGSDRYPVWSPTGNAIVFNSFINGNYDINQKASNGEVGEIKLLRSPDNKFPNDFSPDGNFFAYSNQTPNNSFGIWILPMKGEQKPYPFQKIPFGEHDPTSAQAKFSPDGRWIAYRSDESGRAEIYIRPFPGPGGKWQVSTNGASSTIHHWRGDGKELFFVGLNHTIMAVDLRLGAFTVEVGAARSLFKVNVGEARGETLFDVTADGQRFLVAEENTDIPITLVVNWMGEIKK